jgi:hypothetical protein
MKGITFWILNFSDVKITRIKHQNAPKYSTIFFNIFDELVA